MRLYKRALSIDPLFKRDPLYLGFELDLRVACLCAIESFLDVCGEVHTEHYQYLTIVDWIHLISAFALLGRLCLMPTVCGWDTAEMQIVRKFEDARERLCARMPFSLGGANNQTEDVFDRFRRITSTMRSALRTGDQQQPQQSSTNGSTFEITTSSRQTVSLLQESPSPIKSNEFPAYSPEQHSGQVGGASFDFARDDLSWKFLMGTL